MSNFQMSITLEDYQTTPLLQWLEARGVIANSPNGKNLITHNRDLTPAEEAEIEAQLTIIAAQADVVGNALSDLTAFNGQNISSLNTSNRAALVFAYVVYQMARQKWLSDNGAIQVPSNP